MNTLELFGTIVLSKGIGLDLQETLLPVLALGDAHDGTL